MSWDFDDWNLASAGNDVIDKEVAIVFVNSDSGEVRTTICFIGASLTSVKGYITVDGNAGDRQNLTAWHEGDQLILAVAAQNNNTIVVTNSVGPLILEPWVEHPNVTAVSPSFAVYTKMRSNGRYVIDLDRLGELGRERGWKWDCGRAVWGLEPVWTTTVHDRKECDRLPRST